MIFGFDLSRYDSLEDVRPSFVILNVEDPGFGDKVARAVALGVPWGVYLWIYPGVRPAVQWTRDRTTGLGHGGPPVGYWADFEEGGVTDAQLADWFAQCDALGLKAGYYSGPQFLDHTPFLSRPWWLAAYPGGNDGSYPGTDALWASSKPRPFVLWQFTSTNGTLDQDSVEDEAWWASWIGAPAPAPHQEDDDMEYLQNPHTAPTRDVWCTDGIFRRQVQETEFNFQTTLGGKKVRASAPDEFDVLIPIDDLRALIAGAPGAPAKDLTPARAAAVKIQQGAQELVDALG